MKWHKHKFVLIPPLFFVLGLVVGIVTFTKLQPEIEVPKTTAQAVELIKAPEVTTDQINILLAGYGGENHPGGTLADSIVLIHIQPQEKLIAKIFIPRDLWVEIPTRSDLSEHYKINMAHAIGIDDIRYPLKQPQYKGVHGGGELLKEAVKKVTGFPVDYYASVDFDGMVKTIDKVGKINVDVPVTFDDQFYPVKGLENETCGKTSEEFAELHTKYSGFELEKQFECRYEHLHFDKGVNELNGSQALKFVRSRHSAEHGGDFARGIRLQALIKAVKEKLLSLDALNKVPEFYTDLAGLVSTDLTQSDAVAVVAQIGNPTNYTTVNVNISTDNVLNNSKSSTGQFILVPKAGIDSWQSVQNFIRSGLAQ